MMKKKHVFSIRELLLGVVVISLAAGWWVDRNALKRELVQVGLNAIPFETRLEIAESIDGVALDNSTIRIVILSLGDPSHQIASIADQSLRKLSGNSSGFGEVMSNPDDRMYIMKKWIEWYLENCVKSMTSAESNRFPDGGANKSDER